MMDVPGFLKDHSDYRNNRVSFVVVLSCTSYRMQANNNFNIPVPFVLFVVQFSREHGVFNSRENCSQTRVNLETKITLGLSLDYRSNRKNYFVWL